MPSRWHRKLHEARPRPPSCTSNTSSGRPMRPGGGRRSRHRLRQGRRQRSTAKRGSTSRSPRWLVVASRTGGSLPTTTTTWSASPNNSRGELVSAAELFTRCELPLPDPSTFLAARITETPICSSTCGPGSCRRSPSSGVRACRSDGSRRSPAGIDLDAHQVEVVRHNPPRPGAALPPVRRGRAGQDDRSRGDRAAVRPRPPGLRPRGTGARPAPSGDAVGGRVGAPVPPRPAARRVYPRTGARHAQPRPLRPERPGRHRRGAPVDPLGLVPLCEVA